jgi:broad specificity phosphatase PhoE
LGSRPRSGSDGGKGGDSSSDGGGGGGSGASSGGRPYPAVAEEPDDVFAARMAAALAWLEARPEASIAVVAHWGVLFSLTGGVNFDNCEVRSVRLSRLPR